LIPRQAHYVWPIRVAGQVGNVKQEAVLSAEPRSGLGCPSAQNIADPQKNATAKVKEK